MACGISWSWIVDNEEDAHILVSKLIKQGYQFVIVFKGDDTLAKMAMQDFDAVSLDIRLHTISDCEVLQKKRLKVLSTTVTVITAVNNTDIVVEILKSGTSAHAVKPFDLDEAHTYKNNVPETLKSMQKGIDPEELLFGGRGKDTQAEKEYFEEMCAIARGVEARYDLSIGWSEALIQETIDIAGKIEIPEKVIRKWAVVKKAVYSSRNIAIKSALQKLERSSIAQYIMGLIRSDLYTSKTDMSSN